MASISSDTMVRSWLESVCENAEGAAESLPQLSYLNTSRINILSDLWYNPKISQVVKKVQSMVSSSLAFDPELSKSAKEALAIFILGK